MSTKLKDRSCKRDVKFKNKFQGNDKYLYFVEDGRLFWRQNENILESEIQIQILKGHS